MAVEKLITQHIDTWTSALQTRSTAGRGSNGKIDLYGIKKLRELILELAVRGKLVPQDPNDEPASELLKRIAAEKAELVKQGKIKKQKPLPEISEDEKPFELPKGWEWARLNDLAPMSLFDGDWIESKDQDPQGNYRLIQLADIGVGEFKDKSERYINAETFSKLNCNQLSLGDILIARLPSPIGRACVYPGLNQPAITVVDVAILRPSLNYKSEYLVNAINSKVFREQVESFGKGATRFRIATGHLKSLLIPVSPFNEQNRLVERVSELMSLCDQLEKQSLSSLDAHSQLVETLLATLTDSQNAEELAENWVRISQHFDTLFTTEASIDALKQTILQLAVMGKLVSQDPTDEPASELLKRIEQEKVQLVKEGKIKKQKYLPPISDEEKPFELPQGWEWCRIGDIIESMDAGWSPACSPEPSPNEKIWGVLKTTAVQTLEYREQENKTLPISKLPRQQYEVRAGDILITRAGPKNRVGVSCLVETTRKKLMISDKIIRFHLISDEISAKYISLCLNCGVTAEYLESSKSGMAESQMNISQDNLKFAPVALPPTKIQLKLILAVEGFFSVCDYLKSCLQSAMVTRVNLANSITNEVVRGGE